MQNGIVIQLGTQVQPWETREAVETGVPVGTRVKRYYCIQERVVRGVPDLAGLRIERGYAKPTWTLPQFFGMVQQFCEEPVFNGKGPLARRQEAREKGEAYERAEPRKRAAIAGIFEWDFVEQMASKVLPPACYDAANQGFGDERAVYCFTERSLFYLLEVLVEDYELKQQVKLSKLKALLAKLREKLGA